MHFKQLKHDELWRLVKAVFSNVTRAHRMYISLKDGYEVFAELLGDDCFWPASENWKRSRDSAPGMPLQPHTQASAPAQAASVAQAAPAVPAPDPGSMDIAAAADATAVGAGRQSRETASAITESVTPDLPAAAADASASASGHAADEWMQGKDDLRAHPPFPTGGFKTMHTGHLHTLMELLLAQANIEWSQVHRELIKHQPSRELQAYLAQKLRDSASPAVQATGAHGIVLQATCGDAAAAHTGQAPADGMLLELRHNTRKVI